MAWAKNETNTLTGTGDNMDLTSLTAYKFNQFMFHISGGSSNQTTGHLTFNDNNNSVYARRQETNGGTDATTASAVKIQFDTISNHGDQFAQIKVISISAEEKLAIADVIWANTAGAGNAPERVQMVFKFVPSPDADITRLDLNNTYSGDYQIGDNVTALGTD